MSKVSTAFVIFNKKILLFHRDNKPSIPDPNCWDVIGGHADPGETPDQTLIREVKEEINVDVQNPKHFANFIDEWGTDTDLYLIELSEEQFKTVKHGEGEGQGIEFFNYNQLHDLKLTKNMTRYMKEYDQELRALLGGF